jgi:hypothetical protein
MIWANTIAMLSSKVEKTDRPPGFLSILLFR